MTLVSNPEDTPEQGSITKLGKGSVRGAGGKISSARVVDTCNEVRQEEVENSKAFMINVQEYEVEVP